MIPILSILTRWSFKCTIFCPQVSNCNKDFAKCGCFTYQHPFGWSQEHASNRKVPWPHRESSGHYLWAWWTKYTRSKHYFVYLRRTKYCINIWWNNSCFIWWFDMYIILFFNRYHCYWNSVQEVTSIHTSVSIDRNFDTLWACSMKGRSSVS